MKTCQAAGEREREREREITSPGVMKRKRVKKGVR